MKTLICILFVLGLLIFPQSSMAGVRAGLAIWLESVLPALFPFLIFTEVATYTKIPFFLGRLFQSVMKPLFGLPGICSYPLAAGVLSGYPTGAKVTADIYDAGMISKNQAEKILAFSNNPGPMFITGTIACSMLGRPELSYVLLSSVILSCIITGIIVSLFTKREPVTSVKLRYTEPENLKISALLSKSVVKSLTLIAIIGGYIMFFSCVISIIRESGVFNFSFKLLEGLFYSVAEITGGAKSIASADINAEVKAALTCAVTCWGGISVHCQVSSIAVKSKLSLKYYYICRLVHPIICFFICMLFMYNHYLAYITPLLITGAAIKGALGNMGLLFTKSRKSVRSI